LQWGDLTLSITPNPDPDEEHNTLCILFSPPNGKTDQSKNTNVELFMRKPRRLDACFYMLVLAKLAGAFPPGWTLAEMLDPALFQTGPRFRKLSFNPDKKADAVFIGSNGGRPWSGDQVRNVLNAASRDAGMTDTVLPHAIRRSMAMQKCAEGESFDQSLLTNADLSILIHHIGEDVNRIQHQLRHEWAGQVVEDYVGGTK
jgi:hypothetical protein